MEHKMITIDRYEDLDQARRDMELLEEGGFRPVLVDESNGLPLDAPSGGDFDGVVAIQVPKSQAHEAFEHLAASIDEEIEEYEEQS